MCRSRVRTVEPLIAHRDASVSGAPSDGDPATPRTRTPRHSQTSSNQQSTKFTHTSPNNESSFTTLCSSGIGGGGRKGKRAGGGEKSKSCQSLTDLPWRRTFVCRNNLDSKVGQDKQEQCALSFPLESQRFLRK